CPYRPRRHSATLPIAVMLDPLPGRPWPLTDWAAPPRRRCVVDDRTRHHALRARMDGWWPCAPGNVTVMHRARPTALSWRLPGYAHAGVRRSWGKCAIAFPSPTASASKRPAGLTLEPFS